LVLTRRWSPWAIGWRTRCFDVLACALSINDRLGGRLVSQVLDRLADSTRAQLRIEQEVRTHQRLGANLDPLTISSATDSEVVRNRIDAGLQRIPPVGAVLPLHA
jgi:hypothetical protein